MYGDNIGLLSVYIETGTEKTMAWKMKGNQGDVWRRGVIDI